MATETENLRAAASREYIFGDPTPNAVGRNALVSHQGCVVHLDARSAPRLLWYGEDLLSVKFPAGTRIVYPNPTIPGLRDRPRPIRHALAHPAEMEPLAALLRPSGMLEPGVAERGQRLRRNGRAAESDLLIYMHTKLVPLAGGSKSVGVGLCDYLSLQAHPTPGTILNCDSYFDHTRSDMIRSWD